MNTRKAAVAGTFYPESSEGLRQEIEECFRHQFGPGAVPSVSAEGPRRIVGLVSPHAGYVYSGPAAGHGFSALAQDGAPDLFIIIGPNHRGSGAQMAVGASGCWETPLGRARIDEMVAQSIIAKTPLANQDEQAHLAEHSIEVQLPFLQYLYGENFRFVPIAMVDQDLAAARQIGRSVAASIVGRNAVVIASTDFSHYVPQTRAERQDALALDAIGHLDEVLLQSVVSQHGVSMCGPGPVTAMLVAAKLLGATGSRLLQYMTSGDITGDKRSVVGYGSLVVTK
ncbi:MAG: AmmeMemoRadiSam system protein B [Dehalococcoidia bacterium]|nr:AmmeMemoRadiSam system protein B [Dehalococcoidia bacterium]